MIDNENHRPHITRGESPGLPVRGAFNIAIGRAQEPCVLRRKRNKWILQSPSAQRWSSMNNQASNDGHPKFNPADSGQNVESRERNAQPRAEKGHDCCFHEHPEVTVSPAAFHDNRVKGGQAGREKLSMLSSARQGYT